LQCRSIAWEACVHSLAESFWEQQPHGLVCILCAPGTVLPVSKIDGTSLSNDERTLVLWPSGAGSRPFSAGIVQASSWLGERPGGPAQGALVILAGLPQLLIGQRPPRALRVMPATTTATTATGPGTGTGWMSPVCLLLRGVHMLAKEGQACVVVLSSEAGE
jgi:hypothetical protein